jgi:streptogramin lyase
VNRSHLRAYFLSLAGLLALATAPAVAVASSTPVVEFNLQSRWIGSLAQGPDGAIWYTGTVGRKHWEGRIGRVGPSGPTGETPVPEPFQAGLAVGPEGDAWFLGGEAKVGRLTPTGAYSQVAIAPGEDFTGHATAARDGGIWFTKGRGGSGTDTIGRIDPNGTVTEFPLPHGESRPMAIVEAGDGDAWFTELFGDRIGRITPSGHLTEFRLPSGSRPVGITADEQGNIWFAEQGSGKIGRIEAAGDLKEFNLPASTVPGQIAAAGDGRLWFTQVVYGFGLDHKLGTLGRLTPAGRYSEVKLPDPESQPIDIVAGQEGGVWYAAMGEGPCEGGGGTCMVWEPKNPAIVGHISPTLQRTAIESERVRLRHRGVEVLLGCEGGEASERCSGRLKLKQGGRILGSVGYSLAADQRHLVRVRLKRPLRSVFGTHEKAHVTAIVVASDEHHAQHGITLVRA